MLRTKFKELENYNNLGRALKIYNDKLEIIVTLDIGPRIMHFSVLNGKNILEDNVTISEKLPDGENWRIYGGHRVWHSPEAFPRSYMHDGVPLEKYEKTDNGISMYQRMEPWVQIQKSIHVELFVYRVRVTNRLYNRGAWPIEMAVWSLTVGSRGGMEVCPVVQRNTGLLPNTHYVLWPYSKLNDERVYWGQEYIIVDNDPENKTAFKFGYPNEYGWTAYFNHKMCFIKKYRHDMEGNYPDNGCSWETYSSFWGTELESLSPLKIVQPETSIEHEDEWFIFKGIDKPQRDEDQIKYVMKDISKLASINLPVISTEGWNPNP